MQLMVEMARPSFSPSWAKNAAIGSDSTKRTAPIRTDRQNVMVNAVLTFCRDSASFWMR
jgi:hypothetical protein